SEMRRRRSTPHFSRRLRVGPGGGLDDEPAGTYQVGEPDALVGIEIAWMCCEALSTAFRSRSATRDVRDDRSITTNPVETLSSAVANLGRFNAPEHVHTT